MEAKTHLLKDKEDHEFLAMHQKDPISHEIFEAGKEVVVCGKCNTIYLKTTWDETGGCLMPGCDCKTTRPFSKDAYVIKNTWQSRITLRGPGTLQRRFEAVRIILKALNKTLDEWASILIDDVTIATYALIVIICAVVGIIYIFKNPDSIIRMRMLVSRVVDACSHTFSRLSLLDEKRIKGTQANWERVKTELWPWIRYLGLRIWWGVRSGWKRIITELGPMIWKWITRWL